MYITVLTYFFKIHGWHAFLADSSWETEMGSAFQFWCTYIFKMFLFLIFILYIKVNFITKQNPSRLQTFTIWWTNCQSSLKMISKHVQYISVYLYSLFLLVHYSVWNGGWIYYILVWDKVYIKVPTIYILSTFNTTAGNINIQHQTIIVLPEQ